MRLDLLRTGLQTRFKISDQVQVQDRATQKNTKLFLQFNAGITNFPQGKNHIFANLLTRLPGIQMDPSLALNTLFRSTKSPSWAYIINPIILLDHPITFPVTFGDVLTTIGKQPNSAPREDGIGLQILSRLPNSAIQFLTTVSALLSSSFAITVLKPQKNPHNSLVHRLISLLDSLNKAL